MAESVSGRPLSLRCGLTLPNRLVKASMSENIRCSHMLPNDNITNLYGHWAKGGWGLIITGNVQVDDRYLGTSTDLGVDSSLTDDAIIGAWKLWASTCSQNGTPSIMQLGHPGRQCPIGAGKHGFFAKNVAPSAKGLDMGPGIVPAAVSKLAFGVPRELKVDEIKTIVDQFSRAASLAAQSGFHGIELHASHGYLLDQFLSAQTNMRRDDYGGNAIKRAKLVIDIIRAIRKVTPEGFCLGILLSACPPSESEKGGNLEQLDLIAEAGVDYVHISGGTFEKPAMFLGPDLNTLKLKSPADGKMTPYFLDYAAQVKSKFPELGVFTTGGFRCREDIESAISSGTCDAVGVVRPAAVNPDLPQTITGKDRKVNADESFGSPRVEPAWLIKQVGVTALNVHMDNAWYLEHVRQLSLKKP